MLSEYERLERIAYRHRISLLTRRLPKKVSGLYYSNKHYRIKTITLSSSLGTTAQKTCTLAEELGHHFTVPVNLVSSSKTLQNRYERKAKLYAAKRLIPFDKLIKAKNEGVRNRFELAEYLDVTEEFIDQTLTLYSEQYGLDVYYKGYIIKFKPLDVSAV